jgi:hypothetical protein
MKKKVFIILMIIIGIILYKLFFDSAIYIVMNQEVVDCKYCVIKNEAEAVKVAEATLFYSYGDTKIKNERPYNIKLVNNETWVITGSLNQGIFDKLLYGGMPKFGGVFEIKINAKDGKIIDMIHYK